VKVTPAQPVPAWPVAAAGPVSIVAAPSLNPGGHGAAPMLHDGLTRMKVVNGPVVGSLLNTTASAAAVPKPELVMLTVPVWFWLPTVWLRFVGLAPTARRAWRVTCAWPNSGTPITTAATVTTTITRATKRRRAR